MSLFITKPKPLYAPMLATFGGGSLQGFKSGGADLSLENFPVGHPTSGNYDSNSTNWFSAGFFGVDEGTDYKFSAGQDLSKVDFKYQSNESAANSFFVGAYEKTGQQVNGKDQYRVQYLARIDKPSGTGENTIIVDMSDVAYEIGNPVIPNTGDYFMGWHSNYSGFSNSGNGQGSGLRVDSPQTNASSTTSIGYTSYISATPTFNQTWLLDTTGARGGIRFRFQV
tara:strand:+ start:1388 stop:2062 length:675 start_codon:yes stop_codon:yes gene_type:complete